MLAFTAADILFTLLFKKVAILEIKENIPATLKREMDKRGLTFMEFSTELGIPRTTLQGYLKGTSSPRADTLEELAKKMGISPATLVAGKEHPDSMGISCLDPILLELLSLHPLVLSITQDVVAPSSHDRAAVTQINRRCTKLQLSPEHLLDVVQDFLTQSALSP